MTKIQLMIIGFLAFISFGCQIINVPKRSAKESVEDNEIRSQNPDTQLNTPAKKTENKNIENKQINSKSIVKAPIDEFNELEMKNFLHDFPFANFEVQDFINPAYSMVVFLKSLKSRSLDLLLASTNSNSPLLGIDIPQDNEIRWRYYAGSIISVSAITSIFRSLKHKDKIFFRVKTFVEKQLDFILALKKTIENEKASWKLWNFLFDVKIKYPDAINNFGLKADKVLWNGYWQPIVIEDSNPKSKEQLNLTQQKTSEIFNDVANSKYDIDENFLSKILLQNNAPELLYTDFEISKDKLKQDKILLNFYANKQIKSFNIVSNYFVSANLRIETAIVIFDTKVNKILYLRWFIINESAYLQEVDILSPEKHHIFLSLK